MSNHALLLIGMIILFNLWTCIMLTVTLVIQVRRERQ